MGVRSKWMRFMAWQYRHCVLCNNERLLKLYALLILRICNTPSYA